MNGAKKRILVAEDDRISARLITHFLDDLGYEVLPVMKSGEELISCVADISPDLILMDIVLDGDMDGIDASARVLDRLDVPIIYITRSSDEATVERARFTSPYGYIIKPVDKRDLYASIEVAMARHAMERKLRESETRFSTILRSIADGVIVYDHRGAITFMNRKAMRLLETGEEYMGRTVEEVVNIISTVKGTEQYYEDNGGFMMSFLVSPSGKKIPVEYRLMPQKDMNDVKIGTVLVLSDITGRYESEERLRESLDKLKQTMNGIIMAMVQIVETRDPYTAGHQRRVADLSCRIAVEMELPAREMEGLRMAALIHDLGKISIPSEILSKPGKISDIEFNIMKTHALKGYDILKTIEFPWPVAEIVYQHHERIDGSGYPRGLTGADILLEARIIAVADVLEAMSFDRPYRAAVGIGAALEAIEEKRGVFFDKDVVDACMRIFREKGYHMDLLNGAPAGMPIN